LKINIKNEKGESMPAGNISAPNFQFIPLEWDSRYFGIKCARVNLMGPASEAEQEEIIRLCCEEDFVVLANLHNNNENNLWIGSRTRAFLADINIQLCKQTGTGRSIPAIADSELTICNNFTGYEKLLDIAGEAFRHSRFFNDPYLPAEQAAGIYRQWSRDAFMREDKYFVLCRRKGELAGYLLFSLDKKEGSCLIELVAVARKHTGQGIGRQLLAACEVSCAEQAVSMIRVGTQANNLAAIRLYQSSGFKYSHCNSIYHLWIR